MTEQGDEIISSLRELVRDLAKQNALYQGELAVPYSRPLFVHREWPALPTFTPREKCSPSLQAKLHPDAVGVVDGDPEWGVPHAQVFYCTHL